MNVLFAPAIALMSRLRYPQKFALLGLVALIAMTVLQATLYRQLAQVIEPYYLMDSVVVKLPNLLERLGQMRARGTGILSKKDITKIQEIDVGTLVGEVMGTQRQQKRALEKVMAYSANTRAALEKPAAEFDQAVGAVVDLVKADILAPVFQTVPQDFFNFTTAVIDKGYTAMYDILLPELERGLNKRVATAQSSLIGTLALTVVMALAFAYLAVGAYLSMSAGVRALGNGAAQLGRGDLTGRVRCASRDELGDVAQHFNHMAEQVQNLLRKVQLTAVQLGTAAQAVSASANEVSSSSRTQSDAASSMAAAIEQMTVGIGQIAEHAQAAQAVSAESGQLSEEGGRTVQSTVAEMEEIADSVNQSALIIEALGQHSANISAIVNVIKDIAEQTNLLALNAAIQHGTADAVLSMKSGVTRVAGGVALSKKAGEAIGRIRQGSSRVQADIADISAALREQSAASSEIAANVERITQMVEQNSLSVSATASTAGDLEQLAQELQTVVRHFKV